MMFAYRQRLKIIRIALCFVVCESCAQYVRIMLNMLICFCPSVRLSLYDNCNACFFIKGGQLRWAFAYSGSLPLYSLTHNNILFGSVGNKLSLNVTHTHTHTLMNSSYS